jgi:hypothetical protein
MENSSALIRYHAILRFQILWRFRYQFWIRLEEGAHSMMKVNLLIAKKKRLKEFIKYKILPPSIEFVLPSPALGIANLQLVDPPWMPHAKSLVQQVALNQEEVVCNYDWLFFCFSSIKKKSFLASGSNNK